MFPVRVVVLNVELPVNTYVSVAFAKRNAGTYNKVRLRSTMSSWLSISWPKASFISGLQIDSFLGSGLLPFWEATAAADAGSSSLSIARGKVGSCSSVLSSHSQGAPAYCWLIITACDSSAPAAWQTWNGRTHLAVSASTVRPTRCISRSTCLAPA